MTPEAQAQALDLYTRIRTEPHQDALWTLATQDVITLHATTGLPWSVCSKLTQYARCRWWKAHWQARKQPGLVAAEQRRLAPIERYFVILEAQGRPPTKGDT